MDAGFQVGDAVCCIRRGHGRVTVVGTGDFPVRCAFDSGRQTSYKACGRESGKDINPTLYHTTSGVIEIEIDKPLPKVEKDQAIWVRRNASRRWFRRHATGVVSKRAINCWVEGRTSHTTSSQAIWEIYSLTDPDTPEA